MFSITANPFKKCQYAAGMRQVVSKQLSTHDMEISIVGDINAEEVDEAILKYIGTVQHGEPLDISNEKPVTFISDLIPTERHQVWHLQVRPVIS